MLENLEFEQDYYSGTAFGIYEIGQDSIKLLKWLAQSDRSFFENIIYYDLMRSISKYFYEISQW